MFYHIAGTVSEIEHNFAVIDCGGVGYGINVSSGTLSMLKTGGEVKLYISEAIGENNFDLYGFINKSEKRTFEMLTAVSGIGPNAALSIPSYNTPESLALAIMNNDEKALTIAPGIGKKIAQRVILELKDKVSKELGSQQYDIQSSVSVPVSGKDRALSDALAALAVLGFSSTEIAPVLKMIDITGMSTEQIIKTVLKNKG